MMKVLATLVVIVCGGFSQSAASSDPVRLGVIELIAHPNRYDKKEVVVSGLLTIQFEGSEICEPPAGELPRRSWPSENCIWFEFDGGPWASESDMKRYRKVEAFWKNLSGSAVDVRGVFRGDNHGHLGGWRGALTNVSLIGKKSP